jgi:hypothetical protein
MCFKKFSRKFFEKIFVIFAIFEKNFRENVNIIFTEIILNPRQICSVRPLVPADFLGAGKSLLFKEKRAHSLCSSVFERGRILISVPVFERGRTLICVPDVISSRGSVLILVSSQSSVQPFSHIVYQRG